MPSNSEILAYRGNHCFTHVRVQGTGFGYSDNGNYIPIGFSCDENISSVPQGYNSNINAVKAFIDNNASRWTYIDSIDIDILGESPIYIYPVTPLSPIELY